MRNTDGTADKRARRQAKRLLDSFERLVCNVSKRNPGDFNEVGRLLKIKNKILDHMCGLPARVKKTNARKRKQKRKKP